MVQSDMQRETSQYVSMCIPGLISCQFSDSLRFLTRHIVSKKNRQGFPPDWWQFSVKPAWLKTNACSTNMSTPVPWGQHVCYSQSVNGKQPTTYYSTWMAAVRRKYPRHRAWLKLRKNHSAFESGDCRVQSKWMSTSSRCLPYHFKHLGYENNFKIMWDQIYFWRFWALSIAEQIASLKTNTESFLHRNVFTHKPVYSKTLLRTTTFTKKPFHTHTRTHTHTHFGTPRRERDVRWDEMRWGEMRWDEMSHDIVMYHSKLQTHPS